MNYNLSVPAIPSGLVGIRFKQTGPKGFYNGSTKPRGVTSQTSYVASLCKAFVTSLSLFQSGVGMFCLSCIRNCG